MAHFFLNLKTTTTKTIQVSSCKTIIESYPLIPIPTKKKKKKAKGTGGVSFYECPDFLNDLECTCVSEAATDHTVSWDLGFSGRTLWSWRDQHHLCRTTSKAKKPTCNRVTVVDACKQPTGKSRAPFGGFMLTALASLSCTYLVLRTQGIC